VFMRTPFLYGATLRAAASLLLAGMTIAARRELAHNVGARLGRQSDACRGSATSGGQRSLCEGACGGISGDAPRGGRAFAVLCVARDHGAGQGMRQSRRDAVLGGAVVVQIFMQPRPLLRAPRWSSLASEAQHMARFEREVKTVAALNHMATICGQRCQPQGHDMR
jgi:hypothetical protein